MVARHAYDPFALRDDAGFDSINNHFQFARRRKEESGEVFFRARSYDAPAGRFMQRDPLFTGNAREPFSWNGFIYANNDGVNNSDPSGLCTKDNITGYTYHSTELKAIGRNVFFALGKCHLQLIKQNIKWWIRNWKGHDKHGHACTTWDWYLVKDPAGAKPHGPIQDYNVSPCPVGVYFTAPDGTLIQ